MIVVTSIVQSVIQRYARAVIGFAVVEAIVIYRVQVTVAILDAVIDGCGVGGRGIIVSGIVRTRGPR